MRCRSCRPSARDRPRVRWERCLCESLKRGLDGADVGSVNSDSDSTGNEIDGKNQAGVRPLARQPADYALQGSVNDFDHVAFADERAWVELEIAFNELP